MRHVLLKVFALSTAFGISSSAGTRADTLTIIHLNDTHSTFAPLGPRTASLKGTVGGIARAATILRRLRSANPHAILLHAGDYSMGDISYNVFFGVPELKVLKELGCDAMAIGNHEWDLGPSTLLAALDSAFSAGGFPLLSANTRLDDPALARLRGYIIPATVVRRGGLKVGIFGLTTMMSNTLSSPAPAIIDTPFGRAAETVTLLRKEGCRPIICLSHLGAATDRALAALVPGIDIIVGGHDHRSLRFPVPAGGGDTTWIVQTSGFYREVGVVRLVVRGDKVSLLDVRRIPVNSAVPEDPAVARVSALVCGTVESKYGRVYTGKAGVAVATLREEQASLVSKGCRDTEVGNLVADAFRDLTRTDIAIEPCGSTALPMYRGPLVPADLFRIVGYGWNPVNGLGYHLVRFDISGAGLLEGLCFSLSAIEGDDEFFLQVSGMRYTYNPDLPPAGRLVSASIHGERVDRARLYSVTANAFVAGFMRHIGIPLVNLHEFGGDTTEFLALTRYVQKLGTVRPPRVSRILSTGMSRPYGAVVPWRDRRSETAAAFLMR